MTIPTVFFYAIVGLWGLGMLLNLIAAARFCQMVLERSGRASAKAGLPPLAAILPVALNRDIAQDHETQELRAQMNKRLLIVAAGMIIFFIFLRLAGPQ